MKLVKLWCVKVSYYYGEEMPEHVLETDVKLFLKEEDAVEELNRTIREDWTTEIMVDGEPKKLADCRGIVRESAAYSDDGKSAWAFFWDGDDHGYKGEVSQVEVKE